MANKNNKAFTLVELLAVIVILAVILVIAVPQIMNVITESRKGALSSSAKLIASSAETAYMSNQTLGIEKNIECGDISNYTEEDYASCSIKFVGGKAKVKIIGQGKFEGMAVCSGTKEDAVVVEDNECPTPAVEQIENLATESNTEGLELTSDGNIRYTGASPKNYIRFNDENWRIIGIFNMTTASGSAEKLLKIVRISSFTGYPIIPWDSSESGVNNGSGINEWSQADLMTMLNTYYIGESSTCGYCYSTNPSTCSGDCSSIVTPIKSTYRNMIENVVWNTGAFSSNTTPALDAYNAERGTRTGKECRSGDYCNDTVTRTTTWTGKVGLIYPSDYGFASTDASCRANINDRNYVCKNANWLNFGSYWTISPRPNSGTACSVWKVDYRGYVDSSNADGGNFAHPSLYLKSDVFITSGDGSSSLPYQISIN